MESWAHAGDPSSNWWMSTLLLVLCSLSQKSSVKLSHVFCKHGHNNSSFCRTYCPEIKELNVPGEEVLLSYKGIELVAKTPHLKQLG